MDGVSCVHGYHIYLHSIWNLCVGKSMDTNFAIDSQPSVKKYDVTIGHIPWKISHMLHSIYKERFASCHEDLVENSTSLNNDNIHK